MYYRYCDWKIELPKGYQVAVRILDLDIVSVDGPTHVRYSLSVNGMTPAECRKHYFEKNVQEQNALKFFFYLYSSTTIFALNRELKP